jgi:hypothetical protein
MSKDGVNTLDSNIGVPKTHSIISSIKPIYFFKNKLNKVETVAKMIFKSIWILLGEAYLSIESVFFRKQDGIRTRSLANTLFKFGLSVSGTKLSNRFSFKTSHCEERQLLLLKQIIDENKDTEFGIKHNFKDIKSIEDYQREVSINTYDSLEGYVTRHTNGESNLLVKDALVTYATTSGTTGSPKFIPITERSQLESHQNVSRTFIYSVYKENPEAFDGTILTIVSPAEEGRTPDGTVFGSTSGQLILNMNKVIQNKYTIPYDLLALEDYEARNYCIILLGIINPVSMLSTANPSTLSLLAKQGNDWKDDLINDVASGKLKASLNIPDAVRKQVEERLKPRTDLAGAMLFSIMQDSEKKLRPIHYWPSLKLITCWTGGNSNVFLRDIHDWYGDVKIRDLGYLASEIRGSIPLLNEDSAGALTVGENFFEFIKISDIDETSPRFYLAHELEVTQRYYVFFTTKAGLYRYNINDIVEVRGFENNTPKIIFVQKGKGVTNITGEKLYEQQLLSAVSSAETETGLESDFVMCYSNAEQARYELNIDFKGTLPEAPLLRSFLKSVESNICNINIEYEVKLKSKRLNPMTLNVLEHKSLETFKAWRVNSGIREAQFKTTPLTDDKGLFKPLSVTYKLDQE